MRQIVTEMHICNLKICKVWLISEKNISPKAFVKSLLYWIPAHLGDLNYVQSWSSLWRKYDWIFHVWVTTSPHITWKSIRKWSLSFVNFADTSPSSVTALYSTQHALEFAPLLYRFLRAADGPNHLFWRLLFFFLSAENTPHWNLRGAFISGIQPL